MSIGTQTTSNPNRTGADRASGGPLLLVGGLAAVIAAVGLAYFLWPSGDAAGGEDAAVYKVVREDMVVSVNQAGQLQATNKEILRCDVREREIEVRWLIEEGAVVEPGEVLVRLDTTQLDEEKIEDEQSLESAAASEFASKVSLENTISQSQSDVEKAALDYEFAQLALKKYIEGEYPQELYQAQGKLKLSEEALDRAKDTMEGSKRLFDKGYITEVEYKADVAKHDSAKLDVEVSRGALKVLQEFTFYEKKRKLESDVEQAKAKLERTKNKAEADVEKAKVDYKTAQSSHVRRQRRLQDTLDDIAACTIKAPVAGRVVYAPQDGHRWSQGEPLDVGSRVGYGSELIHLPESGAMSVSIKIDEAQRDKVAVGMPVRITGPNLPDDGLNGKLVRIAEYLDPSGWWNNYLKVYDATVDIDGDASALRTGMNCQTEIIVAVYRGVLTVPPQAVVKIGDQHVVYPPGEDAEPIPVEIGLDNGKKVHIVKGLKEGQKITTVPPLDEAARPEDNIDDLPDVQAPPPNGKAKRQTQQAQQPRQQQQPQGQQEQRHERQFTPQRAVAMYRQLKSNGMLEKVTLDADTKAKLDQAADNAAAGNGVDLDQATLTKFRQALQKAFAQQRGGDGQRPGQRQGQRTGQRPAGGKQP